jgi:predicted ATPase
LLSDGTVSVTAILIALFFENNRLAIIEEPEYGIHPSLVSKLVDTFYEAAKNKQIIITTHSSEILKHIKLEDLRLISRDENGFSTISKPAEKEMVNQFLKNELGINDLFVQNLLDI